MSFTRFHSVPAFYTKQPVPETLQVQLEEWRKNFLLYYAAPDASVFVDLSEDINNELFNNAAIKRRIHADLLWALIDYLVEMGDLEVVVERYKYVVSHEKRFDRHVLRVVDEITALSDNGRGVVIGTYSMALDDEDTAREVFDLFGTSDIAFVKHVIRRASELTEKRVDFFGEGRFAMMFDCRTVVGGGDDDECNTPGDYVRSVERALAAGLGTYVNTQDGLRTRAIRTRIKQHLNAVMPAFGKKTDAIDALSDALLEVVVPNKNYHTKQEVDESYTLIHVRNYAYGSFEEADAWVRTAVDEAGHGDVDSSIMVKLLSEGTVNEQNDHILETVRTYASKISEFHVYVDEPVSFYASQLTPEEWATKAAIAIRNKDVKNKKYGGIYRRQDIPKRLGLDFISVKSLRTLSRIVARAIEEDVVFELGDNHSDLLILNVPTYFVPDEFKQFPGGKLKWLDDDNSEMYLQQIRLAVVLYEHIHREYESALIAEAQAVWNEITENGTKPEEAGPSEWITINAGESDELTVLAYYAPDTENKGWYLATPLSFKWHFEDVRRIFDDEQMFDNMTTDFLVDIVDTLQKVQEAYKLPVMFQHVKNDGILYRVNYTWDKPPG